jgi:RES domain-containing protein
MRDADHFARSLPTAPTHELRARLVRRVPMLAMIESASLDFLFTSGIAYRYNPRGVECLYFAETEETAAAEYARHNRGFFQPVTTYFADVQLRRVLDLCDANTLAALGLTRRDLRTPWVGARRPTATQLLGGAVNQQSEIAAIRFPSEAAREKGFAGANLVIFRDCLHRPDHVHILGPTKKPLQKWP